MLKHLPVPELPAAVPVTPPVTLNVGPVLVSITGRLVPVTTTDVPVPGPGTVAAAVELDEVTIKGGPLVVD